MWIRKCGKTETIAKTANTMRENIRKIGNYSGREKVPKTIKIS
jgi:hypothetical protein